MTRCPYHLEPTNADFALTYTYGEAKHMVVDFVCQEHYESHKASLMAARTVEPVNVQRIEAGL